ncbi:MAG: DHH family phosphoesterase [Candidatus Bathyarchaeum sp.]|nr:MAG: DHH family phosphoesterase [Candidatus Bathyarchaeum sp.]
MQIHEILALIDKLDAKLVVLLCHHNADPDAIGAAFAFSGLLKRLRPSLETEIAAASGPSRLAKSMLKSLPLELTAQPRIEEADLIVLLDTNTIQQLNELGTRINPDHPLVVIDHHASHPETERLATFFVADEEASSTCEVVYRLFKEAEVEPTQEEAKALFLGIAFDTRHFIIATSDTLKVVAELTEAGVNAQETLPILSLPMEHSERVARLKAGNRVKILRIKDWLIALSHVSAYQASASRGLIALGAHMAVVAGQKAGRIQVSLRASREFYTETGIHLGRDLAKPLGEFLGGMGGGHSVSAGANGAGDLEACLAFCAKLLKKKLR